MVTTGNRIVETAMGLVLRTKCLPFGSQLILSPLVNRLAEVQGAVVSVRNSLTDKDIGTMWSLFETMDRLGVLTPEAQTHHRAQLRRLDFRVV